MPAHVFRAALRWGDQDAYGHVNNVRFLDYLQEARVDMLAVAGDVSMLDAGVVVVRHEIDYVAPLVFRPEPVLVRTWVTRVGGASFDLTYDLVDDDHAAEPVCYVRALTTLSAFDFTTGRARRLTEAERDLLGRFAEAPAS